MNKTAWKVGEFTNGDGTRVHSYLWVYSNSTGLVVSDKHKFHAPLFTEVGLDRAKPDADRYRGMVILHLDENTADVLMYAVDNRPGWTHDDAEFIPNEIWKELEHHFKGTRLEEKQGLEDAVSRERQYDELPTPAARQPVLASWNNYLLYRKIAGAFDTKDDLDAYDSEVTYDLYELHDQIMQNPLRGAYTQGSEYYQQRGFDFTYKALKNRLIPAVRAVGLDTGNKDVARDLAKATAELTRAERYGRVGAYEEAGPHLERAFGFVHNAIDRVRYATRKVPAVRSLKPLNPMWASLKTAWQVGETTDRAGRTVHVYLWLYANDKLYVSDDHSYHGEMASDFNVATDDEGNWDEDSSRGMIILHPETRTGEVMMYEGGSHSDAGFIPNDVWDSITYKFKEYKLEEKSGLSEAVSSGRSNGVPDTKPKYAPTFASQKAVRSLRLLTASAMSLPERKARKKYPPYPASPDIPSAGVIWQDGMMSFSEYHEYISCAAYDQDPQTLGVSITRKFLQDTSAVRIALESGSDYSLEICQAPTVAQRRAIGIICRGCKVYWDFTGIPLDVTGNRRSSGSGSLGDLLRSVDATYCNHVQTAAAKEPVKYYHFTDASNRESILKNGLLTSKSYAAGAGGYGEIYFCTKLPPNVSNADMWKADLSGYDVEPDYTTDISGTPEFDGDSWWVVYQDVPPDRLKLIRQGVC